MADAETCKLNEPHSPPPSAIEAFSVANHAIKNELIKLRHHWDKHEPKMFARAEGIPDHELTAWDVKEDLVKVRSGKTAYGTHIFGSLRLPTIKDSYIHVRLIDDDGTEDVKFHSILTDEVRDDEGNIMAWNGIQTGDKPLEWFNE